MTIVGAAEPAGSSRAEGPTGAKIGVTLCCAYSDLAAMQTLEALLREEGIVAEMLPGIEHDANALQLQLVADRGPTIYVLANSKGIEASRLEQLVQMFGAERGPGHRLLVLDVDAEDPGRMVLPVVRAHAAMRKHRSSGELPRRPTQRGLPNASPRKTPSATPRHDREPAPREVQPHASAIDKPVPPSSTEYGRESRRTDREVIQLPNARRRSSKELPRAHASATARRRTPDAARSRARRKPSPTPIGPERRATPREIGQVIEVGPAHDERTPVDSPVVPPTTAPVHRRERLDPEAGREARQSARDLQAQRKTTIEPRTPTRPSATLVLGVGALAIAAIVALFVLVPAEEGDGATERGLAASGVGNVDREPALETPARVENRARKPVRDAKPREPEPRVVAIDPVEEAKRIAAALDARRIHALDALLFVTPDEAREPLDWATATERCKAASIDGVGSWRLPTVAEARKLRGARRLRPGRYWTDVAEGQTVPVVASSGGKANAVPKTETASVICVRDRIRG